MNYSLRIDSWEDVLAEELLSHGFDRIVAENEVRNVIRFLNMIRQKMVDYETTGIFAVDTGSIDEQRIKMME